VTNGPEFATFSDAERRAQLSQLSDLCHALAQSFYEHGDSFSGRSYAVVGAGAVGLLTHGFSQADLTELSGMFPSGPWWLTPKAMDYDATREPWQDEVAEQHVETREIALTLRTLATY